MKKFTVKEVAQEIRRSDDFVYDEIDARRLAHLRIGGRIFVTQSDLDAYLERCRVAAHGERLPKRKEVGA